MKPSDYISVITLAIFGTVLAYFLTNSILGDPSEKTISFEYIETISPDLVEPSAELFNSGAVNPTVEIYVGSCEDLNHDGQIDAGELAECGQDSPESKTGSDSTNSGSSSANSDNSGTSSGNSSSNSGNNVIINGDSSSSSSNDSSSNNSSNSSSTNTDANTNTNSQSSSARRTE